MSSWCVAKTGLQIATFENECHLSEMLFCHRWEGINDYRELPMDYVMNAADAKNMWFHYAWDRAAVPLDHNVVVISVATELNHGYYFIPTFGHGGRKADYVLCGADA